MVQRKPLITYDHGGGYEILFVDVIYGLSIDNQIFFKKSMVYDCKNLERYRLFYGHSLESRYFLQKNSEWIYFFRLTRFIYISEWI